VRSPTLVLVAIAATAACSTPDREFPVDDGSTTSTSTSTGTAPTSSGSGPVGTGGGTGGDTSSPSSSSQGGGDPDDCGNGVRDPGEACDEDTDLCDECQLACPSGWNPIAGSCFAVALGGPAVSLFDAFIADAKCAALDVGATGHRAHAAVPATLEEIDGLGALCPEPGCWLGFYAFGPPGEGIFTAPSTGESLDAEAPIVEAGLGEDLCLKVLLNSEGGSSRGVVDDRPCSDIAYYACELEPSFGDVSTCSDGVVDEDEECDGDEDDELCADCDRQCPEGWSEDPRTHACLLAVATLATWGDANNLCVDAGGRLASPDDVADFRVASALTSDAWLGLEASGIMDPPIPFWSSGETFTYEPGMYPLPTGPTTSSNGALVDGEIVFDLPEEAHDALCERLDPDA
jgi:hypothetical protein